MTASPPGRCVDCGTALALFQPACRSCETALEWEYRAPCGDCGERVAYDGDCPRCGTELSVWRALEAEVLDSGRTLAVWKDSVPRPTEAGYRVHLGSVHGQWVDYRRSLGESGEAHVRSYPRRYELHHDDVSALDNPGRHLLRHGLPAAVASGTELGARTGRMVVKSGRLARRAVRSPSSWLRADGNGDDSGENVG